MEAAARHVKFALAQRFFRLPLAACLQAGGRGRGREIDHSLFYCNYSALPAAALNRLLIVEEEWLVNW